MNAAVMRMCTWSWLLAILAMLPAFARADSGTIRISQRHSKHQITVFTDPTPLRAGPVDVSVLVQDLETGIPDLTPAIDVCIQPRERSTNVVRYRATSAAASTKLFQAANFDLPRAGWWEITIDVYGSDQSARVCFDVEAAEPLPPWQELWPWFCWPLFVVALFAVCQHRVSQVGTRHRKGVP
ncbi:MAG TPA: hypothetical protein VHX39_17670 [Acetobacteraceae bacterium]|jgi:hypothetical protein|nr:hypothetical protein [Acetobacteraceae bacterium]